MTVSIWKFFIRSSHTWFSYIRSHLFITSRVYYDPTLTYQLAPCWFVSSVGRALHRYRRGHELKSRTGLNISQHLFSLLLKKCSLLRRSLSFCCALNCKFATFVICALSVFFFLFLLLSYFVSIHWVTYPSFGRFSVMLPLHSSWQKRYPRIPSSENSNVTTPIPKLRTKR